MSSNLEERAITFLISYGTSRALLFGEGTKRKITMDSKTRVAKVMYSKFCLEPSRESIIAFEMRLHQRLFRSVHVAIHRIDKGHGGHWGQLQIKQSWIHLTECTLACRRILFSDTLVLCDTRSIQGNAKTLKEATAHTDTLLHLRSWEKMHHWLRLSSDNIMFSIH